MNGFMGTAGLADKNRDLASHPLTSIKASSLNNETFNVDPTGHFSNHLPSDFIFNHSVG